jgi:hypothetical protein
MKYFITLGDHKHYLASMVNSYHKSEHFYAEKISIEMLKKISNGTFKYMYDLEEAETILKKYYRYRKKKKSDYTFTPKIVRCSIWLKVNKKNL